jgi:hypothetical protein
MLFGIEFASCTGQQKLNQHFYFIVGVKEFCLRADFRTVWFRNRASAPPHGLKSELLGRQPISTKSVDAPHILKTGLWALPVRTSDAKLICLNTATIRREMIRGALNFTVYFNLKSTTVTRQKSIHTVAYS